MAVWNARQRWQSPAIDMQVSCCQPAISGIRDLDMLQVTCYIHIYIMVMVTIHCHCEKHNAEACTSFFIMAQSYNCYRCQLSPTAWEILLATPSRKDGTICVDVAVTSECVSYHTVHLKFSLYTRVTSIKYQRTRIDLPALVNRKWSKPKSLINFWWCHRTRITVARSRGVTACMYNSTCILFWHQLNSYS